MLSTVEWIHCRLKRGDTSGCEMGWRGRVAFQEGEGRKWERKEACRKEKMEGEKKKKNKNKVERDRRGKRRKKRKSR